MNERSFNAVDLVSLPVLDVAGAIALGKALRTAAEKAGKLPDGVRDAFEDLELAHDALVVAAAGRLRAAPSSHEEPIQEIDRRVDASWAALFDFLSGWSKIPDEDAASQRGTAERLLATLYPERLKFTQLPYRAEWSESERRLQLIQVDKLDAAIRSLGGGAFLVSLKKAHATYGKALGITETPAPEAPLPDAREPLLQLLADMRTYVLRIAAHVDRKKPATEKLAERLLAPLKTWTARPSEKNEPPPPAPES